MNLKSYRPKGFRGKGDRAVLNLPKDMLRCLLQLKQQLNTELLNMSSENLHMLAGVLVEFGEDLHNDIGIWETLEHHNKQKFGTPLPVILSKGKHILNEPFDSYRIKFFLWHYFELLHPLPISPQHPDLHKISIQIADFFEEYFYKIPKGSGISKFLSQPNHLIRQIKRKINWLGAGSYLFRFPFKAYLKKPEEAIHDKHDGNEENFEKIYFLYKHCTIWSGFTVIELLTPLLECNDEQRAELLQWHQQHTDFFRVKNIEGNQVTLVHLFSNKVVEIIETEKINYVLEDILLGSPVMYNGKFHWLKTSSNIPHEFLDSLSDLLEAFEASFIETSRYLHKETALLSVQNNQALYESACELFGDNFVHITNIDTLPQKLDQLFAICEPKITDQTFLKKQKENYKALLKVASDKEPIKSVGLFFDPKMDSETILNIDDYIALLQKKETDQWLEDEKLKLVELIRGSRISPPLVHKLLQKYGGLNNIYQVFGLKIPAENDTLAYLLQKYKGLFYKMEKDLNQHLT